MTTVKLSKVIARAGICSRRNAESLILEGRVTVNGAITTNVASRVLPNSDEIAVDGRELFRPERELYIFHKPSGVVTTLSDEHGRRCVGDLLPEKGMALFPVGRLDYDTSGLLLITNDGELAERLTHPRYETPRVYIALVKGVVAASEISKLRRGVALEDGEAKVKEAVFLDEPPPSFPVEKIPSTNSSLLQLTVAEGRNHFVKRICAAIHHPVIHLHRISFGDYHLTDTPLGEFRRIER